MYVCVYVQELMLDRGDAFFTGEMRHFIYTMTGPRMTSTMAGIPPRRYYNWRLSGFYGTTTTPKGVQGTTTYMDAWWAMVLSCDPVAPSAPVPRQTDDAARLAPGEGGAGREWLADGNPVLTCCCE